MWKKVWPFKQFEDTWKNSYWWKTIQLLKMWASSAHHSIWRHMREFILKKIFSCSKCENKFSDRSAWKRHEIIHTDEKPFSCSKWEKKFLDRSAWKIHEKIYTERKLFSCSTQPITAFEDTWENLYWWKTIQPFKVLELILRQEWRDMK